MIEFILAEFEMERLQRDWVQMLPPPTFQKAQKMLVVIVVLPGSQGESFELWNDIWEGTDERWENTQDVNHCMDVGTGMYGQRGEGGEPAQEVVEFPPRFAFGIHPYP